jgi:hypothetical protein
MFKKKESDFQYFNEEWNRNEPTTDDDLLEDGVNDYFSIPTKSEAVED